MEYLDWDFLGITILENTIQKWIIAIFLTLILALVLRFLRRRISRTLQALAEKTQNKLDDFVADIVSRTKLFVVLVIAVWAGAQVVSLPQQIDFAIRSAVIVVILLQLAMWGNALIQFLVVTYVRMEDADDASRAATSTALVFIGRLLLWSLILLVGLQNLGVEVTALLASLGVGGIAVALASQNILGDLLASLSIHFDRPFAVGDFIIVGDLLGTVEKIGLKTTRVRSLHGEQLK